jgi:hypothetical protein
MKAKLIILLTLLCMLICLCIYLIKPVEKYETKKPVKEVETLESFKSYTYIITEIRGNDYYGQSIDGKTKIFFNRENVKFPIIDTISVNDKISAYVESENHIGGLVKIKKID